MGVRRNPPAYGGRVKANSMMNLFHTDEESTLFTEWSFNCPVFVETTSLFYLLKPSQSVS